MNLVGRLHAKQILQCSVDHATIVQRQLSTADSTATRTTRDRTLITTAQCQIIVRMKASYTIVLVTVKLVVETSFGGADGQLRLTRSHASRRHFLQDDILVAVVIDVILSRIARQQRRKAKVLIGRDAVKLLEKVLEIKLTLLLLLLLHLHLMMLLRIDKILIVEIYCVLEQFLPLFVLQKATALTRLLVHEEVAATVHFLELV